LSTSPHYHTTTADKEGDKDAATPGIVEEEEAPLGEDPDDVLGGEAGRYLLSEEEQRKRYTMRALHSVFSCCCCFSLYCCCGGRFVDF